MYAFIADSHAASIRVVTKLGFNFEPGFADKLTEKRRADVVSTFKEPETVVSNAYKISREQFMTQ